MIDSTPQGHACPDFLRQSREVGKIWECWQLWPIVEGIGNGAAEEDWRWDLNPGAATLRVFLEPCSFSRVLLGDYEALAENHRLLFLFLRYGTPDWAEGEGSTVHLWVF